MLFIETPICQFRRLSAGLKSVPGATAARPRKTKHGPAPHSGNREELRYKIATEDRHAHNSPNVVNKALTKLKIGQGLFKIEDAFGAAVRHSFSQAGLAPALPRLYIIYVNVIVRNPRRYVSL